jgi:protein-disulfide isomerase
MKNIPLLVGTLIGTILLIVAVSFLFSKSAEPKIVDQAVAIGNTKNIKGPENAKVTVVEYSDLQCPACRATQPVVDQVLAKHGNEIRFVYKHFPLTTIHKNAQQAALYAQAAAKFNKFWEWHDLLFANQDDWAELNQADLKTKFDEYLDKLQIDKKEFQKKIESNEVQQEVTEDVADGEKVGVNATPTFYVNGQETTAPQLMQAVESALSQQPK